jgi:protein-S-isoprenylcysteine O-methyltransferase Ste14
MSVSANGVLLALLAVYLVAIIARAIGLWRALGINPFAMGQTRSGWARVLEAIFPWVGIAWVVEVVLASTDAPMRLLPAVLVGRLFDLPWLNWLGVGLAFGALVLFLTALASLGSSWRIGIDRETPGRLVTSGVFAFSRNPIFVSMMMFAVGAFLVAPTWVLLAFALTIPFGIHAQVLEEESFLLSE